MQGAQPILVKRVLPDQNYQIQIKIPTVQHPNQTETVQHPDQFKNFIESQVTQGLLFINYKQALWQIILFVKFTQNLKIKIQNYGWPESNVRIRRRFSKLGHTSQIFKSKLCARCYVWCATCFTLHFTFFEPFLRFRKSGIECNRNDSRDSESPG